MIKIKGAITKVSQREDKYGIRLDNELPGIWLNGFGGVPGLEGDIIELEYEEVQGENKMFYNVRKIINVEKTNQSIEQAKEDIKRIDTRFTDLMRASVDLCVKRNMLGDNEIKAAFIRLLKLTHLYDEWEQLNMEDNNGNLRKS